MHSVLTKNYKEIFALKLTFDIFDLKNRFEKASTLGQAQARTEGLFFSYPRLSGLDAVNKGVKSVLGFVIKTVRPAASYGVRCMCHIIRTWSAAYEIALAIR